MNALVEKILDSPTLPEIVDELQARLAKEQTRREEFYEETTEDQKAEFINGQVIMHSPAKARHLEVRDYLHELLEIYVRSKNLGVVRGEKALCVFPRNDYEPDICFFGPEKTVRITPQLSKFPIPDFVVEILSDSTAAKDRGEKFQDYQAHGVREYWIIDTDTETVEQYVLKGAAYELAFKSYNGEVLSVVVAGFAIPVRAIFDAQTNLAALRSILLGTEPR